MPAGRPTLPFPALVLVTDGARLRWRQPPAELDDIVREAVLGGVNVVQLREKHLSTPDLIALGLRVRDAIAGRALLFVNGDLDAARALAADGIHLPSYGPTIRDVRATLGDGPLVSLAVHSNEQAIAAEHEGADLLQLGTAFETASKPGIRPLGIEGVRAVCASVKLPVIAIGGVTADNARALLEAGARGVAVMGAIMDAVDPRAATAAIRQAIDDAVRQHTR
ncbi:MAG: thiamine phosphate synthase [Chloroflexi bacterium]|nr:thiamine phosphate synthase [Chloroflexota bacterium]